MLKSYLEILKEDLLKKSEILDRLTAMSSEQQKIASAERFDTDAFDKIVDDKDQLVQELIKLDDGFEETYSHIRDELPARKDEFKTEIALLQDLIRKVTNQSMVLQALEERNKEMVAKALKITRSQYSQSRLSSKVAFDYYKNMTRVNYIDPQLMDRKK